MQTIRNKLNVSVGYSDHTDGIEISLAAVALGAKVIEKHLTLDKNLDGPDHKASLEPDEFAKMSNGIRRIKIALGSHEKKITDSEVKNALVARKSLLRKKIFKKTIFLQKKIFVQKDQGTEFLLCIGKKLLGLSQKEIFMKTKKLRFKKIS